MIIDLVLSAVGGAVVYAAVRDYKDLLGFMGFCSRNMISLQELEPEEITEESSEEKHLRRLKRIYKEQNDIFLSSSFNFSRTYSPTMDRLVLNSIVNVRNNTEVCKLTTHGSYLEFNNGLKVWVSSSSDYYGFGTVCEFDGNELDFKKALEMTISCDTQLLLLELVSELKDPVQHKIRIRDDEIIYGE